LVVYVDWHVLHAPNKTKGAKTVKDVQGATGFWSFTGIDANKTRVIDFGYVCKSRSQLVESLAQFRQDFGTPATIQIDRDTVAISTGRATFTNFEAYCLRPDVDIQLRTSSTDAQWQNGVAE